LISHDDDGDDSDNDDDDDDGKVVMVEDGIEERKFGDGLY